MFRNVRYNLNVLKSLKIKDEEDRNFLNYAYFGLVDWSVSVFKANYLTCLIHKLDIFNLFFLFLVTSRMYRLHKTVWTINMYCPPSSFNNPAPFVYFNLPYTRVSICVCMYYVENDDGR